MKQLKNKWSKSRDIASGRVVIELFGKIAMELWEGAEALIDAYLELEEETGESPSRNYIDNVMYFKIKGYWSDELSVEQLNKLDTFLSRLNK
jgi:hypothetical protein